jgi:two-component system, NarL family, sensor histidine kinase DevS
VATRGLDEHRLRSLLDVGRALVSERDRQALLRRVLEVARELTGARYAALGILDSERREIEGFFTSGIDDETYRAIGDLPQGHGILGELIREPKPLRLRDIAEHPRSVGFPAAHPPMATFLGAPIVIRGEAWGNLYLTEKEQGEFDERDEESLTVLAEWAAIAIDNARLYERLEDRRQELERAVSGLEATTAISRAIGGETDLARVLQLVVKRARALVDARALVILLAEQDELVVSATAGEVAAVTVGTRLPSAGTVPGQVVDTGHAERLSDVAGRLRLGLDELAEAAHATMLVPLIFRGRTVGVLVALDRLGRTGEFEEDDERLMQAFAASAATAVATAQSVERDQLRRSLEAAERERTRWARELHDETLQGLCALQLSLESGLRGPAESGAEAAARMAIEQIKEEIEKLQRLIIELRPAALDDKGLESALASLGERTRAIGRIELRGEFNLEYERGRNATRLTPEIERTVYRLVQEALTNIAKHAQAESASVIVNEADGGVTVEVRDDGRGFDAGGSNRGFGLVGMRERVDLLAGTLSIESAPASGTTIRAEIPARHRDAESDLGAKTGKARSQAAKTSVGAPAVVPASPRIREPRR